MPSSPDGLYMLLVAALIVAAAGAPVPARRATYYVSKTQECQQVADRIESKSECIAANEFLDEFNFKKVQKKCAEKGCYVIKGKKKHLVWNTKAKGNGKKCMAVCRRSEDVSESESKSESPEPSPSPTQSPPTDGPPTPTPSPTPDLPGSPDGPSQQCEDDAGPPWADDEPGWLYHSNSPATPLLGPHGGECPHMLKGACAAKGAKAAFLEGPVDCGADQGWFCRISVDPSYVGQLQGDLNFGYCNGTGYDEPGYDQDGHCHGSSYDDTFGWWARDHWFRGYKGKLDCCCGWRTDQSLHGFVNRCDYRKHVKPEDLKQCRDANEEHDDGYEDGCQKHDNVPFKDPLVHNPGQCWSVDKFGDPEVIDSSGPVTSDESGDDDDDDDDETEKTEKTGGGGGKKKKGGKKKGGKKKNKN